MNNKNAKKGKILSQMVRNYKIKGGYNLYKENF